MPTVELTSDTWTDIKAAETLSDDTVYVIQNTGAVEIQAEAETATAGSPSTGYFRVPKMGAVYMSAANGTGIWCKAVGNAGEIHVEVKA